MKNIFFVFYLITYMVTCDVMGQETGVIEFFNWVERGKIEYVVVDHGGVYRDALYYYICSNESVVLNNSVSALNYVLKNEEVGKGGAEFLESELLSYFRVIMLPSRYRILDEEYLDDYLYELDYVKDQFDSEQTGLLKKYCSDAEFVIDEYTWVMSFYCITENGAVESYSVKGNLHPINIVSVKNDCVLKAGSVVPLTEYGTTGQGATEGQEQPKGSAAEGVKRKIFTF